MRKAIVIAFYFIIFWIALPAGLILAANMLDTILFQGKCLTGGWVIAGYVIMIPGISLMILSVIQFRYFGKEFPVSSFPPQRIIERGLFAVWRHPIYLFASFAVVGMAMISASFSFLLIILPLFLILIVLYILNEERVLEKRFGEAYRQHRKRVPILVPRMHKCLKVLAFPFFRMRFRLSVSGKDKLDLSPPFFVVAAHRNYLDPFFISYALPWPIKYITTYEMFRKKALVRIFSHLGSIPKKRYAKDMQSVRMMIRALEDGHPVGVFPEGGRSWTGDVRTLKRETLEMFLRFKHIPLLPVRLEGNYQSWPRWSPGPLRGKILVQFEEPIVIDDTYSLESLNRILLERISPAKDADWQYRCRSSKHTGHLSTVLYRCPACRTMNGLKEDGDRSLNCLVCGIRLDMDELFQLRYSGKDAKDALTVSEMHKQIRVSLEDLVVDEHTDQITGDTYVFRTEVEFMEEKGRLFEHKGPGDLVLTDNGLKFLGRNGLNIDLPFGELGAVTIESYFKLQLYRPSTGALYQVVMQKDSVLKWQEAILLLMEKNGFVTPVSR